MNDEKHFSIDQCPINRKLDDLKNDILKYRRDRIDVIRIRINPNHFNKLKDHTVYPCEIEGLSAFGIPVKIDSSIDTYFIEI